MSIYATWLAICDDEHEPWCARWAECGCGDWISHDRALKTDERHYVPVDDADCTCPNKAPIVYQGSHVNPSDLDVRGGEVQVAAIPNFCHPSVRGTGAEDGPPVEFLRLSVREDDSSYSACTDPADQRAVGDATVVLDRRQVAELEETCKQWRESRERF